MGAVFGIASFIAVLFFVGAVMEGSGRKCLISACVFVVMAFGSAQLYRGKTTSSYSDCERFSVFANSCD